MPRAACLAHCRGLLRRGQDCSAPVRRLNKSPMRPRPLPARPPLSDDSTTPPLAASRQYQNAGRMGWQQGPSYAAPNIKSTAHHVAATSVFQRGEWARGSVSQFEISAAPKCCLNRWERRRIQKTSYSSRGNPSAWRILAPTAGIASLLPHVARDGCSSAPFAADHVQKSVQFVLNRDHM